MIKTIKIKNFRSLVDVEVELAPVTVLIGRSGTGKTNFIMAIRVLSEIINTGSLNHDQQGSLARLLGGIAGIAPVSFPKCRTSWEVTFTAAERDYRYFLMLDFSKGDSGIVLSTESLWIGGRQIFLRQDNNWEIPPKLPLPPLGPIASLAWLAADPEINDAYITLARGLAYYEFSASVLATPNAQQPPQMELASDGANYQEVIRALVESFQWRPHWNQIEAALRRLSPQIEAVRYIPIANTDHVTVSTRFNGQLFPLPLSAQSAGFRRVLAYLLAIYQQPPKAVLLFEEPENGIFPGALQMLGEFIRSGAESRGVQFIFTSHSPQMLDAFEPDSIRVVDYKGSTKIGPLDQGLRDSLREGLLSPSEILTVTGPAPEYLQSEAQ